MLQHLSTKVNVRNVCQDLLTIKSTDSDLKVQSVALCRNELLVRVRLPFQTLLICKLAKQAEKVKNYQKHVFVMIE